MISSVAASVLFLAGCGGSSGNSDVINPPQSETSNATFSFSEITTTTSTQTTTYGGTSILVDFGARAHLTDVGPYPVSPGYGTTIVVIDDFKTLHASTATLPLVNRSINAHSSTERYSATYRVPYQIDTPISHGRLVAGIAGGYSLPIASAVTLKVPTYDTADLASCTLSYQATQLACPQAFHANAPASTLNATLSMSPIPGVASEATIQPLHVDLSSAQNAQKTDSAIHGHLINSLSSSVVDVINLSLGSDMPVSTDIMKDLQNLVDTFPMSIPAKAVITVSAGNSSTPCGANFFGCNVMAMALVLQSNSVNSTIVAGALTGTGAAQRIASYTTLPGDLANRLIYASGDTGFYGNAVGTSFAAPRVAGVAAIIKQKFPALTSDQIATIILQSADKDMNNDGIPDFVGVDPIYGNGKLSLKNAMALAATY